MRYNSGSTKTPTAGSRDGGGRSAWLSVARLAARRDGLKKCMPSRVDNWRVDGSIEKEDRQIDEGSGRESTLSKMKVSEGCFGLRAGGGHPTIDDAASICGY